MRVIITSTSASFAQVETPPELIPVSTKTKREQAAGQTMPHLIPTLGGSLIQNMGRACSGCDSLPVKLTVACMVLEHT